MKTTTFLPLPKFTAFGGALFKSNKLFLSILYFLVVTPWHIHSVTVSPGKFDPIVVALSNAGQENLTTNQAITTSAEQTTSIDVESVPLVELNEATDSHSALISRSQGLPDYILQLNDPDIGGPVDYEPTEDKRGLNVIAWDLLPPWEAQITDEKYFSHNRISTGHNLNADAFQESSQTTQLPQIGIKNSIEPTNLRNSQDEHGESYYTSTTTTDRAIATKPTTTTTTTTAPSTTTPRTTTTRRTTTPRTRKTTTTATTTTTPTPTLDPAEFFKLEAGDSYTLPPWLQDIDDPDLDVAVTFEIPEDINEYNHTVEQDLLPPLEPYTDLNNLNITPPTNHTEVIITTTTTTTTTRRPTNSASQLHWVRAKPTTPNPTVATFNKQFTSLHPSITSPTNLAQRTKSITTTTTTNNLNSSIKSYNRQISSNTAQTDKIGSSSSSSEEDNPRSTNPFLRKFNDGKYKSQQTTTTTTTTTTPAPLVVEKNPFEGTIPPWLKDFDYPELGPGVPFVYDPNEDEYPLDKNILPPNKSQDEPNATTKPNPNSPFVNSQKRESFPNKFSTSTLSLTSSSSIPSITIMPFPSAQQNNQGDSTFPRHPIVFATKTSNSEAEDNDDISKKTSTTFNQHFPAPFESSGNTASGQKKIPLSADRESFSPFNSIIIVPSTVPSKTTFSKSEDGKVITNNVFLNGGIGSMPSKPIGSNQAANSQEKNSFTTQSSTGSSFTTSADASAFVTSSGTSNEGSKYTGHFGGPPGVLAPNVNGFPAGITSATKSINNLAVTSRSTVVTSNKAKFTGSFGGPPGVLKPYDNVKNR